MLAALLPYFLAFSRIGIGLVFAASSIGKLRNFPAFERAIANFQILPRQVVRFSACLFLTGELAVVALLPIGGRFLAIGFWLAIFLLLIFCVALLSVLARGIQTPCNCFGSSQRPVSAYDMWRNVGFMVCALAGLVSLSALPGTRANLSMVELGLLGLMAVVFVVLWAHLGEFLELFSTS